MIRYRDPEFRATMWPYNRPGSVLRWGVFSDQHGWVTGKNGQFLKFTEEGARRRATVENNRLATAAENPRP